MTSGQSESSKSVHLRCRVVSNKTFKTHPADLLSFNVAHSDDATVHSLGRSVGCVPKNASITYNV